MSPGDGPSAARVASPAQIRRAAELLRGGGVVAFPTETVYGLGADARSPAGLRAVYALKGRPSWHPLIVHVSGASELEAWADAVPALARRLAEHFWPGPLTLILPRARGVLDLVTGGLPTVGLRAPRHPVAQALLAELRSAIAAPSANRFGCVSPTRAEHVRADFGAETPLLLEGGACAIGLESTIVDLSGSEPRLVRPGAVTPEELARACGRPVPRAGPAGAPASGTLPSHYAPRASVELVSAERLSDRASELLRSGRRTAAWIARGRGRAAPALPAGTIPIEVPADLAELARSLYEALREVDRRGADAVLVVPPEERGLGLAITDRLRRASAARERPEADSIADGS